VIEDGGGVGGVGDAAAGEGVTQHLVRVGA
jgi:hypothetical protein